MIAGPAIDPVITIYGDNFFSTSVVTLQQGVESVDYAQLDVIEPESAASDYQSRLPGARPRERRIPIAWTLAVTNPAPPNNPSQAPATTPFLITSPTQPGITTVVNAASYLPTAIQTGTGANPVPVSATSVVAARHHLDLRTESRAGWRYGHGTFGVARRFIRLSRPASR